VGKEGFHHEEKEKMRTIGSQKMLRSERKASMMRAGQLSKTIGKKRNVSRKEGLA